MIDKPKVAVVVLNWNGRHDTLACLASLQQVTYRPLQLIVVDNGSADNSVAAIRAAFPGVDLVETGRNLGYAGGNNVGIRHALDNGADHVLLLNNDTEVDPGLVDAFVAAAARHPEAGAFGARIYFHAERQRLWWAGAHWNGETARFEQVGENELDADGTRYASPAETPYACGCAMFLPAPRLREVGLLDDAYFLYFEETDWCYRARAAGHPSIVVPAARLWHKVSVSMGGEGSPLALYFLTRNKLLWARRHGTPAQRRAVRRATLQALRRRFLAPLGGDGWSLRRIWWNARAACADAHNRAFWLGLRDYLLGRYGDCPPVVRELAARSKATAQARAAAATAAGH